MTDSHDKVDLDNEDMLQPEIAISIEEKIAQCRGIPAVRKIVQAHIKKTVIGPLQAAMKMNGIIVEQPEQRRLFAETVFASVSFTLTTGAEATIRLLAMLSTRGGHPATAEGCEHQYCPHHRGLHPVLHMKAIQDKKPIGVMSDILAENGMDPSMMLAFNGPKAEA